MNHILLLLALLLPTRTVDGIVSFLSKVAERLAAAEAKQTGLADDLRNQAKHLIDAAEAAEAEGARFGRMRGKLTDLVA